MPIKSYTAWACDLCGREDCKDDGQGPQPLAWTRSGWRKFKSDTRDHVVCPNCRKNIIALDPTYLDQLPEEFRQVNAAIGRLEDIVENYKFEGPDNIPSIQADADDVRLVLDYLVYLHKKRN
jgi:hypothetical protein